MDQFLIRQKVAMFFVVSMQWLRVLAAPFVAFDYEVKVPSMHKQAGDSAPACSDQAGRTGIDPLELPGNKGIIQ